MDFVDGPGRDFDDGGPGQPMRVCELDMAVSSKLKTYEGGGVVRRGRGVVLLLGKLVGMSS